MSGAAARPTVLVVCGCPFCDAEFVVEGPVNERGTGIELGKDHVMNQHIRAAHPKGGVIRGEEPA